jgi:hypothetical protein
VVSQSLQKNCQPKGWWFFFGKEKEVVFIFSLAGDTNAA